MFFVIFLKNQVKTFVALGPVYTVGHIRGLLRLMVDGLPEAEVLRKLSFRFLTV